LGLIAPGLTAAGLCPLVKSNPQAVIAAVASGAARAYDQGSNAINAFAGAMGAAVGAANSNGCINEVFEGVNQAIIMGGFKVEFVTGKALAMGVAQGVASEGGEVLAKATAVVICRGGASASACAKAWNQAIKIDPKNGCAVLVRAYVHARAYCSAGKAYSNVQSTVFKEPIGTCAPETLYGAASGSYTPQGAMSISQGQNGQTVTYPDGTVVTQGPGVSISVWATNGGRGGQGVPTYVMQGVDGQRIILGRKMLRHAPLSKLVSAAARKLLGVEQWPFYGNSYDNNANSFAQATNNGIANGPVVANSNAFANDNGPNSGYGGWGCWWCSSRTTANSAAVATNNGVANGPVVANSNAFANGRH
jgi:hypothetical protein